MVQSQDPFFHLRLTWNRGSPGSFSFLSRKLHAQDTSSYQIITPPAIKPPLRLRPYPWPASDLGKLSTVANSGTCDFSHGFPLPALNGVASRSRPLQVHPNPGRILSPQKVSPMWVLRLSCPVEHHPSRSGEPWKGLWTTKQVATKTVSLFIVNITTLKYA